MNAPSGLAVQDVNGALLMNVPLIKVNSASTTVLLVGDSTTLGNGVEPMSARALRRSSARSASASTASAVWRWGWSGYTTFSINALNSTSQVVNFWTGGALPTSTGTTSPSALAAPYVIIDAGGTNDYFGVYLSTCTLSTSSAMITVTVSRRLTTSAT